jgi:hypothetical protein
MAKQQSQQSTPQPQVTPAPAYQRRADIEKLMTLTSGNGVPGTQPGRSPSLEAQIRSSVNSTPGVGQNTGPTSVTGQ